MLRSALSKVMWVGRATVFLVGLAVILAVVLGVASAAFGANGDFFRVGKSNFASAVSVLDKSGAGPALSLRVDRGAPLQVNSESRVARLNADTVDGKSSSAFMPTQTYVVNETVEMGSNTVGTTRVVFCDEGDVPMSGGFSGLGNETQVSSSYRNVHVGQPTWWVSVRKAQGPEDTWTAQAVCADFAPLRP
jgi:hypothetical protein